MIVRPPSPSLRSPAVAVLRKRLARALAPALLGVFAALLVGCSGSGKGLIPTGDAGPLQSDFEAVARAAETGDGECAATESALLRTEQDFARLPSGVDGGLRDTLRRGIENLRKRSLALCAQPLPQATTTQTTPKTTTSTTTTAPTAPETQTTSTPSTPAPAPSGPGGGTAAPREEAAEEEGPGNGKGEGKGKDKEGGAGGSAPGVGDGGQEAGR